MMYFKSMTLLTGALATALAPLISGGIATLLLGRAGRYPRTPGLLFHAVTDRDRFGLSHYPAERFSRLVDRLHQDGFKATTLAAMLSGAPDDRSVVLTFDDGFEDFLTNALPCLDRHDFTATVFAVGSFMGKDSSWDVLPERRHMSAAQLRQVAECGIEIGSHTLSHPALTFLSEHQVRRELEKSRKLLEDTVGKPVRSLSFPFGCWNERIWQIALDCGYRWSTVYRGHSRAQQNQHPVSGVYRFDSVEDILERIAPTCSLSTARARAAMLPHFAKGSPIWKWRAEYAVRRKRKGRQSQE
jgi:peptidoglycan/xylan/chitin deacetylase (PgdA/CDA1 family)